MERVERNPDSDFVLHGKKESIRSRDDDYISNSQRTLTTKNLSSSMNLPTGSLEMSGKRRGKVPVPNISDLERSINELKLDLKQLNDSLRENYGKSNIFLTNGMSTNDDEAYMLSNDNEEAELTHLMQRRDDEAVSHLRSSDHRWFSDPKHLTKSMGDFPTMQSMGVSRRSVSPLNRSVGRFGSEIATKDINGKITPVVVASNEKTFPVKLTAPHIVGVRSLLAPTHPVRKQNRERAKSPRARSRSFDPELMKTLKTSRRTGRSHSRNMFRTRDRSPSPLPVWMPTSNHANASAKEPPPFKRKQRKRGRSLSRKRPATAGGYVETKYSQNINLSQSLPLTSVKRNREQYIRPNVRPMPGHLELSFLRSADQIDTRRALVENSPYQQELSRLRLERLRVEEEYLLQLKRESELERIRGPKPKWYEMKGPEFHYECNKNTALHKNSEHWGETLGYRDHLLEASREFTANMRKPLPALE